MTKSDSLFNANDVNNKCIKHQIKENYSNPFFMPEHKYASNKTIRLLALDFHDHLIEFSSS